MTLFLSSPDTLFWLALFTCLIAFIFSFYKSIKKPKLRSILILRGFLFIILIFLFLNPKIERTFTHTKDLKWNIYLDRSLSMSYHSQPSVGSLVSGVDQLIKRIRENRAGFNIIGFGNDLDTTWIFGDKNISDGSTDIGQVIEHIKFSDLEGLAGSIIITDGQANLGAEIPSNNLDILSPIYIIGVGNETPLVDVSIHAIHAPPVIIKGENADLDVTIASHGSIDERLNVTLYSGNKLIGSKVITVSGEGSLDKVRFRINPTKTGEIRYRVQASTLSDEINIQNNKQIVPIQVLKNEYTIALFTGAPNFNTKIIKQILSNSPEYSLDHYVYRPNGYSKSLKYFWDKKYDLIIFDNHPVQGNAKEWHSYLRVFAKKLISHHASLAFIMGHDIHEPTFESYLSLMDVEIQNSVVELGVEYEWGLNPHWDTVFPFHQIDQLELNRSTLPPLVASIEIDTSTITSLANFTISDVDFPLYLLGEKSSLRFMIWTSPGLNKLYLKTKGTDKSNFTRDLFNPVFSWLMRTGNGQDFYFRSEKNSYQQGERVTVSGKPIRAMEKASEGLLHVLKQGKRINSKPMVFNEKTGQYSGQFWASQSGKLDYEIELNFGNNPMKVGDGSLQVQESQVELNHVYLNKSSLIALSEANGGQFINWDNRLSLLNQITPKTKVDTILSKSVLHERWWVLVLFLGLLTAEWVLRRRLGLM